MTRSRGLLQAVLATLGFTFFITVGVVAAAAVAEPMAVTPALVRSVSGEAPAWSQWVTLPRGTDQVETADLALWADGQAYTLPASATISSVMIMRGQPGCVVSVPEAALPFAPEEQAELRVQWDGRATAGGGFSRHGLQETSGAAPASNAGCYLIVAGDAFVPGLASLVEWKGQEGYDVRLYAMGEIGNTVTDLQEFIQNAYDTWDNPPLYVLLVGDVEHVPTHDVHSNVSDHPYACVDGDDWVADLYIGRLSVKTTSELATQVAKTVGYEKAPYVDGANWFNRSLMVAGNSGSSTPVSTCRWVADQLEEIGQQRADSCYFPPIRNGVTKITEIVDEGVSIVAYRGWAYGDVGWEPPRFTNDEIPGLNNGWKLPVVFSLVCHTGNYGNAQEDCFGETWLKAGTAESPQGAVAFFGTGEHWSHSRWNDQMVIGVFEAFTHLGVREMGHLMVATKVGLVSQFPTELHMGPSGEEESVEYYNYIYNLLGDPSLSVWTDRPRPLTVTHAEQLVAGQDFLPVTVTEEDGITPVPGARVAISQNARPVGYAITDETGHADVCVSLEGDTAALITVTGENLHPYQQELPIHTEESFVMCTAARVTGDGPALPGTTITLDLTIENTGTQEAAGIEGTLTAPAGVALTEDSFEIASLDAGAATTLSGAIAATLDSGLEHGTRLRFRVRCDQGGASDLSECWLQVLAPELTCEALSDGEDDIFDPGEPVSLTMTLGNQGHEAGALSMVLRAVVPDLVTVTDSTATMPAVPEGGQAAHAGDPFALQIGESVAVGTPIPMELVVTHAQGPVTRLPFNVVAGLVDFSAPIGPDAYGYYCYDSADIDYRGQAPVYRWIECSPRFGGEGTLLNPFYDNLLGVVLELPFPFTYYGVEYDSIRVHENGWIAFDTSYWYDIRNWNIPGEWGSACQVAPFWDNLVPPLSSEDPISDGIYAYHDEEQHCFVVEWSRLPNYEEAITDDYQTFQVVLRDPDHYVTPTGDGEIVFQYKQIVNDDYIKMYSTVGIEDHTETVGMQYSYANAYAPGAAPLAPGLAIKYTTEAPVRQAIELARFEVLTGTPVANGQGGLELRWHYDDERPLERFHLERARAGAGFERLAAADLPPVSGRYLDPAADPGQEYAYRMVGVDRYGKERVLGEVTYRAGAGREPMLRAANGPVVRGETTLRYHAGATDLRSLEVIDLAGRRVRNLYRDASGAARPASGEVVWDGRDDAGHPLPGGVYWVRLRTQEDMRSLRLVIVR